MKPVLPAPQPVSHRNTLFWWLGLASIAVVALAGPHLPRIKAPALAAAPAVETRSFHAFAFGRAIEAPALKAQLEHLVGSGAHAVSLQQVEDFMALRQALPAHPVLLTFDEAGREAIDAADPVLADLGLTAVAFVSVAEVERGNIALVSRRRLAQMAESGRWQLGLRTCESGAFSLAQLRHDRELLERWAGAPVRAVQCVQGWTATTPTRQQWANALGAAGLALGFVPQATGATLRSDSPAELRSVRIAAADHDPESLTRRALSSGTRDHLYVDEFAGTQLSSAWIGDPGHARVESGALLLAAAAGDAGGELTLAGTERWNDAQVDVDLRAPPAGEFWIYARHAGPKSFVRLGVVDGQVILQKADGLEPLRQLGATPAPEGPARLTLRVIGPRALAFVGGRALLDRPAELPDSLAEGPVSIAAWDPDAEARARVERIEVTPLTRRVALVDPSDRGLQGLRGAVDSLWGVSPPRYRWSAGKASERPAPGALFEMYVRHHRLALLPAVEVSALPGGDDWEALNAQLLRWAEDPRAAGLNLVVRSGASREDDRLIGLRRALEARGKLLVVTRPESAPLR